jgi:sec-independent protein translocase protein TatA
MVDMFGLGMGEALILLAVVVLLFGGKKLPELGNSMGKAITNFKKGMKEEPSVNQDNIENIENKDTTKDA